MKISNSFKTSIFNFKLFKSKGPLLLFIQILSTKHFPSIKIYTQNKQNKPRNELLKIKPTFQTSTF